MIKFIYKMYECYLSTNYIDVENAIIIKLLVFPTNYLLSHVFAIIQTYGLPDKTY